MGWVGLLGLTPLATVFQLPHRGHYSTGGKLATPLWLCIAVKPVGIDCNWQTKGDTRTYLSCLALPLAPAI